MRLWIDLPQTLDCFVTPSACDQALRAESRIAVLEWRPDSAFGTPADLVIETFGCDLPAACAEALAHRKTPARWYNLEYLSAEDWVEGCHALPSPHPRLPVSRTFFFPGFSAATGGLLREPGLIERRRRVAAEAARARQGAGLRVGLFCYQDAPVADLLSAFAAGPCPVLCRVFRGPAQALAQAWAAAHPGAQVQFEWLPWMGQDAFDEVLWSCDFNVVRGEDSFVRAQWAGCPFVWDIYPQTDQAHLVKMAAFLRRYREGLDDAAAQALGAFWQPWIRREPAGLAAAWTDLVTQLPRLREHAEQWCDQLAARPDLADALLAHAQAARC